jgi:hypothetical protein
MASRSLDILGFAGGKSGSLEFVLLILSVVFTVGVLIALVIMTKQVMKSKWIESRSVTVLFAAIGVIVFLLLALWVLYLLYVGVL